MVSGCIKTHWLKAALHESVRRMAKNSISILIAFESGKSLNNNQIVFLLSEIIFKEFVFFSPPQQFWRWQQQCLCFMYMLHFLKKVCGGIVDIFLLNEIFFNNHWMNWDTSKPWFNTEPPVLHLKLQLQKENDAIRLTKAIPEYRTHKYGITSYCHIKYSSMI